MSGEAGGALLIPLAIGVVPFIGMVLVGGAIYLGVKAASDAMTKYENEQRQKREEIRRSGINESIGSFRNTVHTNMQEQYQLNIRASEQMRLELEKSRKEMISIAESDDPAKYQEYIGKLRESSQTLSKTLFDIQEGFVKNYQVKIHESMDNVTRTIDDQYASYLNELQQLTSNLQAKQERAGQLALTYIDEAKAILLSLEKDFEGAKFVGPQLIELQRQLNEAIREYNLSNFEAALATAKGVSLGGIEEIYNADCKKQEWDNYFKLALSLSSEIEAYLSAQSVITAETKQKVEERLGKTLEEEIVGVCIRDYTDKMRDGQNQYDYLMNKVTEIKTFLESDEAKNLSIQQLKEYVEMMNSKIYPASTMTIHRGIMNMNNAFSRQNISEDIIDFFEDHNFSFKGYSYDEDKHDGALHIGLENEATGEEIIVTLAPELLENGEVQTRVEIDQLMGDEANEERKAFYRKSVEDVVKEKTPGAQIKLECKKDYKNKLSDKTHLRDKLKV